MKRPTVIWLYPLPGEHFLPMLLDLAFFAVVLGVWRLALGLPDGLPATLLVLAAVAVFHALQLVLVSVRFDDTGITIVRPWRIRRIEWSRIAGLIYTPFEQRASQFRLRLVLKGSEPPLGRYLTAAELAPYAKGPVVMLLGDPEAELHVGSDRRSVRCVNRVLTELERHGFPRPPARALEFRSPRFTPDETRLATAIDQLGLRPVTVTHGTLVDVREADLIDTVLPELARTFEPEAQTRKGSRCAVFLFKGPDAKGAFLVAARDVVPTHWRIASGALPDPDTA